MNHRDRFRAGKRLWSTADDAALRRAYPNEPNTALARRLRRTVFAIYGRANILGVKKSVAYLASPHACRLRRGDEVGKRFRFPKGHVPANKGLRRPGWSTGRMKETQFKAGVLNGVAAKLFMPIGSTRLCGGYLYRKISAEPGPWTVNWKLEHWRVWTAAHGPVPAGHALTFRNHDRTDVGLDNLELITRRELMARNTIHHVLPPSLAKAVQLLGALNRKIRRRPPHAEHHRRSA
jgi:hypothetical protein